MAGLNTLNGASAARPVGEGVRNVLELVQSHHQLTGGNSALDQLKRRRLVERQNAPVSFGFIKRCKGRVKQTRGRGNASKEIVFWQLNKAMEILCFTADVLQNNFKDVGSMLALQLK